MPFLRAITVGIPTIYPNSIWMSLELATYGFVIGFLYFKLNKKRMWCLYCCLVAAMISGRVIWGISKTILLGISGKAFTVQAFIVGGIADSLSGIILQLILIPVIIKFKDVSLQMLEK